MQQKYVIITAGGSGVRMHSLQPKQFLLLKNKPVLMHSVEAFIRFYPQINIVIVLPPNEIKFWEKLCDDFRFTHQHIVAEGGPTRFHSVKNGLKYIPDDALVAIHDGVRPLVSQKTIADAFHFAEKKGNGIPAIAVNESVRLCDNALNRPVNRDSIRLIQTPQCFNSTLIKRAYLTGYDDRFTDDASVLESIGERIYLSEGNRENIKITTPHDLLIAEALMKDGAGESETSRSFTDL
jgi:2-C-methyl-D-erythritol 4-phosphate cytidylyltransferase